MKKKNNYVTLSGEICSDFKYVTTNRNVKFYMVYLKVYRFSGKYDIIPLMVSERLIDTQYSMTGLYAKVTGSFRSHNEPNGVKSKVLLYVYANWLEIIEPIKNDDNINIIELDAHIPRIPEYRRTPMGRDITDTILAVNRLDKRTDYLPAIFWGRDAKYVKNLNIGDNIKIIGRIQSREYEKKISDTEVEVRTAYEVSVKEILK